MRTNMVCVASGLLLATLSGLVATACTARQSGASTPEEAIGTVIKSCRTGEYDKAVAYLSRPAGVGDPAPVSPLVIKDLCDWATQGGRVVTWAVINRTDNWAGANVTVQTWYDAEKTQPGTVYQWGLNRAADGKWTITGRGV